ncbi:MAG TPA: hypothetical protein VN641_02515 [Urbifossiella sp.]|nr:hypothetical protein [Urbifossiella sp.]
MSEELKPARRRSKYTRCEKTVLVRIHVAMLPRDSTEFIERAKNDRPPGDAPILNRQEAAPLDANGAKPTSVDQ